MSPSQAHIRALVYPLIHRRHRNRLAPSGKIREARDAELLLHNVFWNPSADAELTRRDPPSARRSRKETHNSPDVPLHGFLDLCATASSRKKFSMNVFGWIWQVHPELVMGVRVRDALAVGLEDVRGLIQLLDVAIRPLPRHVVYVVPFVLYGTFRDCEVCTEVVGNIWKPEPGRKRSQPA